MSQDRAIILFGHGARDPEWAAPMRRMRARLLQSAPDVRVELAFMEFMSPTLDQAVDAVVADGARAVTVVPIFLAQGGHLKRDVPLRVEAARRRHPGTDFTLAPVIGEDDGVLAAMAAAVLGFASIQPQR
ncbi:cobalamin biosynthesis protein CbiX [Zoogloeaceae bacteirum Par-f-2]|uniref:sirohydrochlorin chelatase n=1 Tax=Pseudothauera hydrothermalis TaxID=2184083 RepID=UPI000D25ADA5|nr:CbiX/SirB N-terminal domain-containing protein [Pseudothauera hydrothermalis]AVZ78384.1 cobalamin biosynthesis protein CbiX [Zoogloeaceae bacteirum Par-f-2]